MKRPIYVFDIEYLGRFGFLLKIKFKPNYNTY